MSKTATATVEVLTAEVRVLMVGSRQITLSVSRQLDRVPWRRCNPFGRIRDNNDYHDKWIIGVDTETGALVRSILNSRPKWTSDDDNRMKERYRKLSDLEDTIKHYHGFLEQGHGNYAEHIEAKKEEISRLKYVISEEEGFKAIIPDLQAAHDADLATFNALPLIVLAGLK